MGDAEFVAAIRGGDAEAIRAPLEAGADPDMAGEDGLPVLCPAVAAYDASVAGELVEGGADQDRRVPDGTTTLLRAVDPGSPAVFRAVLGREPGGAARPRVRARPPGLRAPALEVGAGEGSAAAEQ
ncbi:hypothetical protein [Streptomyces sp. NPDC002889]|uniref:hypothetical protein n=1 Tax=Streptomyces sp. NPDC002889 TaxID=3364669 RepID=UPI0036CBB645